MEHCARRLFGSAPILHDLPANVGPIVVWVRRGGRCANFALGPNAPNVQEKCAMSAGVQRYRDLWRRLSIESYRAHTISFLKKILEACCQLKESK
jgi:hypothetical protein